MEHKFDKLDFEKRKGISQELVDIWKVVGIEKMPTDTKKKYDDKKAKESAK